MKCRVTAARRLFIPLCEVPVLFGQRIALFPSRDYVHVSSVTGLCFLLYIQRNQT
jgi:hypothetical protein